MCEDSAAFERLKSKVKGELKPKAKVKAKPKPKLKLKLKVKRKLKVKVKLKPKAKVKTETKSETKTENEFETESDGNFHNAISVLKLVLQQIVEKSEVHKRQETIFLNFCLSLLIFEKKLRPPQLATRGPVQRNTVESGGKNATV